MDLQAIADEIRLAQDRCGRLEPLTARVGAFDAAAAYRVAHLIHEVRVREGARPIGRKIGFTNRSIWPVYGVYEPIWAHVYDTTVVRLPGSQAVCGIARYAEPRIEPEIVVHFGSTPTFEGGPLALLESIDWIAHGIEIVQSHFPGWKFKAADTIADSALHGTLLVGQPRRVEHLGEDLASRLQRFSIQLSCGGQLRGEGRGANVLDGPLHAIAHLMSVLATQRGATPLCAGELVTTGTLTDALPVRAGETWSTAFEGIALPGMSVTFAP